ncbi:hypothetical protein Lser_V15G43290 [Lactuca serriola]
MKSGISGLTFFLVALFAFILISSAGRTHQTTVQPRTNKEKGDAVVEPERAVHTDDEWGGCWGCWNNHDRRRLLR